jgi:peptidoglycan hydrolase-like protein with peptidoglycan-binding domain
MNRTAAALLTGALFLSAGPLAFAQDHHALTAQVQSGRSLRQGAEGPAVRDLQSVLRRLGHPVSVDGDFGPRTKAAVAAFQRSKGLSADGVVGPQTLAAIDRQIGAAGASGVLRGDRNGRAAPRTAQPANTQPAPQRPGPRTSAAATRAQSLAWARSAQARGSRTLVVAFEGLWSYSSSFVEDLYEHQDALRAGRSSRAPRRARMSFVSKHLLSPNLSRHQNLDFLVLPETSERKEESVALRTILAWREVHGSRLKVVLVGHSFGAYSALKLANKLGRRGVQIHGMLAIDARTMPGNYRHFVKPRNVGGLYNYYQKGLMPGYEITGAQVNQRLRGFGHGKMPSAPQVQERFHALLR